MIDSHRSLKLKEKYFRVLNSLRLKLKNLMLKADNFMKKSYQLRAIKSFQLYALPKILFRKQHLRRSKIHRKMRVIVSWKELVAIDKQKQQKVALLYAKKILMKAMKSFHQLYMIGRTKKQLYLK